MGGGVDITSDIATAGKGKNRLGEGNMGGGGEQGEVH